MNGIKIESVIYAKIPFLPGHARNPNAHKVASTLSEVLAKLVIRAMDASGTRPDHLMMTSTIMPSFLIENGHERGIIANHLKEKTGIFPIMTCAYECSGWGYILQKALHAGLRGRVMIVIQDINAPHLSYWKSNPSWGKSGFGVAVVTLNLSTADNAHLIIDAHAQAHALKAFRTAIANHAKTRPTAIVSSPFFPTATARAYRAIAQIPQELDNLHDTYGHCFGSDPWIGLILSQDKLTTGEAIVGSLALNGYFSIATLDVAQKPGFEFLRLDQSRDDWFQPLTVENGALSS